jgi:flagellar hook assembly protein FlgD
VSLYVYNVLGQEVRKLADSYYAAGTHHISWDGRNEGGGSVSSGIYFYRIEASGFSQTRKMIILK